MTNLKNIKNKRVFFITGKNSYLKSSANLNFKLFSKKNNCEFYFKKEYIPQYKELKTILNKINKFKPHFIFGIGGGCVLDYSKLSKIFYQKNNIKKTIKNNSIIKNNYKVKLYLFPTTAGSGSEATTFSAIYFNNNKMSYDSKKNIVDKIIYLPKVLTKCTKYNRSSSGIDAFNQSLESIFSRSSNTKSINYSKKSLELIFKFLIKHINNPNSITSKQMARAAYYSGKAINIAKTNAPHALSYPFTYYFNIDHGHAVSLTFLNVLKFNFKNMNNSFNPKILENRFRFVFKIFKVKNINSLIDKVKKIYEKAGVRTNFKEYNIDIKKEKKLIIKNVNLQRLNNNPVLIEKKDLETEILID